MDEKFIAVVYKSADLRDFDKRVFLITPYGAKTAVMRGVKKPAARLRFAAMPFAFCEYTAVGGKFAQNQSGNITITGASQIEDLFALATDPERLVAGSIILEAAYAALKSDCAAQFVFMLKRLKDIIYAEGNPHVPAVRFLQYLIHSAGYGYEYTKPDGELDSPIELLSALYFMEEDESSAFEIPPEVLFKTLTKLLDNFERKFEMTFLSKKLI